MDSSAGVGSAAVGWSRGADGTAYPPAPWDLVATLLLGVFAVPTDRLPAAVRTAVPDGLRAAAFGRRTPVAVGFARYHPGGVLAYSELLVAVLGFGRYAAPRWSVGQIWVDSPASRTGGQELWAIPKQLGRFTGQDAAGQDAAGQDVTSDGGAGDVVRGELDGVARVVARPGRSLVRGLPGRLAPPGLPLVTAQHRGDGVAVLARCRVRAWPRLLRARWTFERDGPLGYLADRRHVVGLAFVDAPVRFGLTEPGMVRAAAGH